MSDWQEKTLRASLIEKHIILVLSLFGGMLGVDRAYNGDWFLAFLKTITLGGLFIWYILDIWYSAERLMRSWRRYNKYLAVVKKRNAVK